MKNRRATAKRLERAGGEERLRILREATRRVVVLDLPKVAERLGATEEEIEKLVSSRR